MIGESFAGSGQNAAHVNTVLGRKGGPVETAWATALATPRQGHVPFVAVLRPNVPVKPATLFVNKADVQDDRHAALTWGAAQAGVAQGVLDAVAEVWVDWAADDEEAVYEANVQATRDALAAGAEGGPAIDDLLGLRDDPANPFFRAS
jgi:5,6,7,8-tetrahydromethanopterin hydro-lyase